MSVGTTVRVGWDASAAKKGFAGLSTMFSAGLRGFRQVGIGAAREVGARVTDLVGRIVMAIPEGLKETMDWAGNLTDMSAQTGVAVSKLVLMEEALRLAGASAADTSKMISTLNDNLYEAIQGTGAQRDALNKLGFSGAEFVDLPIDKAFEMIGKRVAQLGPDFKGLEGIMADLFGARLGYKLIRFFRDFDGGMNQAQNNVGDFARRLDGTAPGYDKMSDALGRFQMRWRETMSIVIDQVTSLAGDDWVDKMFDGFSPEKIRNTLTVLRESIAGLFTGDGFSDLFRGIGRSIGEGIRESLKGVSMMDAAKSMIPDWMLPKSSTGQGDIGSKIDRSNALLLDLTRKQGGWA